MRTPTGIIGVNQLGLPILPTVFTTVCGNDFSKDSHQTKESTHQQKKTFPEGIRCISFEIANVLRQIRLSDPLFPHPRNDYQLRGIQMTTSQLRNAVLRFAPGNRTSLQSNVGRALTASRITPARAFSSNIQNLQAEGVLDERGLVNFDTLHELQLNSCKTFASSELFGTYSKDKKIFEWDTYDVFAEQVAKTRAVLRGIGKYKKS